MTVCPADLTKEEDLKGIQQLLEKEKPRINILINSAGFGVHGKVEDADYDSLLNMVDLNCRALTAMTKICLPFMEKGGRIIQLASSAAFAAQPKFAVYAASKAYVLSFSRALNEELADRRISVTAVCPGPVDTEFFRHDDCNIEKTFYKRMVMAKAQNVVRLALKDAAARKMVSVYGKSIKAFRILTKVVPHGVLLKGMGKFL